MASGRIRNVDDFEIYNISYLVPGAVMRELERLAASQAKGHDARKALEMAATMRHVIPDGDYADDIILHHIKKDGGTVATTDVRLKRRIRAAGGDIITLHDDCMVWG